MEVDNLIDLALDGAGNFYTLQLRNPVIKKYSIQGKLLNEIKLKDLPPDCPFPDKKIAQIVFYCLAVDKEENLYLTPIYHFSLSPEYPFGILKFSPKGEYLEYFPKKNRVFLRSLIGANDNFYLLGNCEVRILDTAGKVIDNFGQFGEEEENFFWGPRDITMDGYGNIYAGDAVGDNAERKRLQIFDNYGRLWEKFPYGGRTIRVTPDGIVLMDAGKPGTKPDFLDKGRGVPGEGYILKNEIAAFAPSKLFFFSELTENYESGVSVPGGKFIAGTAWKPGISDKITSDYFEAINYLKQKKVDKADAIFQKLILAQPDNFHLLSGIARIYRRLKEYDKSASILDNLLKLHPERYDLYLRLAEIYERQERYDEAVDIYNKGIAKVKTLSGWEPDKKEPSYQDENKLRALREALFILKEEKGLYPKKELVLANEKEGWHADALPEYKLSFSFGGKGSDPGQFNTWSNKTIAVDSKDRIMVADAGRIQMFSPEGTFISQIKMNIFPVIAVDSRDRIFTVKEEDSGRKVVILSEDGNLINSSEQSWESILDLGFKDGNILVLATRFQEMNILDSELRYLKSFDIYTDNHGAMVFDKIGNMYLATHRKVKVYDPEGNYLYAFPNYSLSSAIVSNDVICIYGDQHQLYFYNLQNKELIYQLDLEEVWVSAMALDSKNRLIIADSVNNKIFVFEPVR